jgi:hypothetical protein
MRKIRFTFAVASILLWIIPLCAKETPGTNEAAKLLPDRIGNFKAINAATATMPSQVPSLFEEGSVVRTYASDDGSQYSIEIQPMQNDSEAFALLTQARSFFAQFGQAVTLTFDDLGTASFTVGSRIFFYKGSACASVSAIGNGSSDLTNNLARQLAQQLSAGEGEVPVLVKHLPNWETTGKSSIYCVTTDCLRRAVTISASAPNAPPPVLDVLSFDGGTEAVAANYGPAQLLIVEFTTPQFSVDNDQRIWTKIAELKNQGQPIPSAYRRVGNYSVFVFNAADEKTANALIDQVKYEQVVQWLGDDPHLYQRLQKYFTQTSAGVLIAVLKSSGLSLLFCLAAGALIGTMLFRHRRAQRAAAYSDAGGSVRLNLDELTGPVNKRPVISGASKSEPQ